MENKRTAWVPELPRFSEMVTPFPFQLPSITTTAEVPTGPGLGVRYRVIFSSLTTPLMKDLQPEYVLWRVWKTDAVLNSYSALKNLTILGFELEYITLTTGTPRRTSL